MNEQYLVPGAPDVNSFCVQAPALDQVQCQGLWKKRGCNVYACHNMLDPLSYMQQDRQQRAGRGGKGGGGGLGLQHSNSMAASTLSVTYAAS